MFLKVKTKWEIADGVDRQWAKSLLQDEGGRVVKQSPAKIVTVHRTADGVVYVKRSRHAPFLFRPLKYWFKDSPSRWEWGVAQAMQALGIPAVKHLALCEIWSARGLHEDILITEGFDGKPLDEAGEVDPVQVMDFVGQCHQKGMVHGDLHLANILLHPQSGELRLVDLKGVRIEKDPDSAKQMMDLAYLNINFPMPLPKKLLRLSDQVRRKKMATRCRRCLKNNREFAPQFHGGRRWWVRRPLLDEGLTALLVNPDSALKGDALLKDGTSNTVGRHSGWVVKRYNFKKPLNLIKDIFRPSKAKKSFRLGYHLELLGIPTARVVAVAEDRVFGFLIRSFLIMEEVSTAVTLGSTADRDGLATRVGKLIGRLHHEGFSHRDLKESNLLVDEHGKPYLIDLDCLKYDGKVTPKPAIANLIRLDRGLQCTSVYSRANWIGFIKQYCRETGLRRDSLKTICAK